MLDERKCNSIKSLSIRFLTRAFISEGHDRAYSFIVSLFHKIGSQASVIQKVIFLSLSSELYRQKVVHLPQAE